MKSIESIKLTKDYFDGQRILLPERPGVYAFWWLGKKEELLSSNTKIKLKGPKNKSVEVKYQDWWPECLNYPCLYVGKSTNLRKRFSLHIKRKSLNRLHPPSLDQVKVPPVTSSCQLRHGIEHLFPNTTDSLSVIYDKVGFSFSTDFTENAVVERFFEEDRLIGNWRPWFNIDSER